MEFNYNDRNTQFTSQKRIEALREAREKRFWAKWCFYIGIPGLFFGIGFFLIPIGIYLKFRAGLLETKYRE